MATPTINEPPRETPIVDQADVLVAGGGPAGVATALSAARAGARVRLIETHGCLGGIWTSGLLSWILDAGNKRGIMRELLERFQATGDCGPRFFGGRACDPEAMKLLLETLCAQANVAVRLHTRVVAVRRDPSDPRRLSHVITESKSGREAFAARVFIDATGDGDLAAGAGCGFDFGRDGDGKTQPMSMIAYLAGIPHDHPDVAPLMHRPGCPWGADSDAIVAALRRAGVDPSYGHPILIPIHDSLCIMMANHEYGQSGLDAGQITAATLRSRAEVHRIVDALRTQGGAWGQSRLVATAAQIGVREGRRIHGRYTLTARDLIDGAQFDDAICRVTFPVDVHALSDCGDKKFDNAGVKARPYDIPLRALIARDVDGLLMAGRCISGDFSAHASYRVTGNAVAMGQAAGAVAAVAIQQHCLPHEAPWAMTRELLQSLNGGPIVPADDAITHGSP